MTSQPFLPLSEGPRVILYHQTHHGPDNGPPIPLLPLLTNSTGVTHVVIAAIHLNDRPGDITLNNDAPDDPKFSTLWAEVAWLQASGVKVLGMLGGAAKGSFAKLDGGDEDDGRFEAYYSPLRDMIRAHRLNGLDLDVEEEMSLDGIVRLIDRLRTDFGPDFLISLAPVATALLPEQPHLSGFDYGLLEELRGSEIAWYNAQFYCGWGDASTTYWYDAVVAAGWKSNKVVMGLITNPSLGAGHVEIGRMQTVLRDLRARHPAFGGVMGWEYFSALPGGEARPWEWAAKMAEVLRVPRSAGSAVVPSPVPPSSAQPAAIRPFGAPMPAPAHPFPAEKVQALQDLGFGSQQAVAALNMTNGNVEQAAVLLLDD